MDYAQVFLYLGGSIQFSKIEMLEYELYSSYFWTLVVAGWKAGIRILLYRQSGKYTYSLKNP